jgi:hypothetical protein
MAEASGSAFAKSKKTTSAMSACRNLDHCQERKERKDGLTWPYNGLDVCCSGPPLAQMKRKRGYSIE